MNDTGEDKGAVSSTQHSTLLLIKGSLSFSCLLLSFFSRPRKIGKVKVELGSFIIIIIILFTKAKLHVHSRALYSV